MSGTVLAPGGDSGLGESAVAQIVGIRAADIERHVCASHPKLKVDVLIRLAAYSVRCAHDIHSGDVDGLQIAVCRDKEGQFQFIPPEPYWDYAPVLDSQILAFLSDSSHEY